MITFNKLTQNLNEAVSMKNAKGAGFGKSGGYDKYVTLAKKKKAKSHKDVVKALSREGLSKEELSNAVDYVMNALGESVETDLEALSEAQYFSVQYYNGNKNAVDDKFKNFKSKAEADKYAKKGNAVDRVGGEYKVFKVKGQMESVESKENKKMKTFKELREAKSDCTVQNDGRMNLAVCIDGLSFQDARKGTRGAMMNIKDFQKTAKIAYVGAKGKPTLPAVKKEIKMLGARNFYAKWQADSASFKDDSVQIWYTK